MFHRPALFSLVLLVLGSVSAEEPQWGDLTLRFVLDGEPPKQAAIAAAAGAPGCGAPVFDEKLVVNAKDKGIANLCVYLLRKPGDSPPPIHPDFEKSAAAEALITNKACRFEPRVVVLRTTQTLVKGNADPTGHNMKADFFENAPFNDLIPSGGSAKVKIPNPEFGPTKIECGIHPWMSAYLFVRDDPYAAVSDKSGKLKLEKLPAGKWTFVVWHQIGYIKQATLAGTTANWERGRITLDIKTGANDLGEVKLSPALFK